MKKVHRGFLWVTKPRIYEALTQGTSFSREKSNLWVTKETPHCPGNLSYPQTSAMDLKKAPPDCSSDGAYVGLTNCWRDKSVDQLSHHLFDLLLKIEDRNRRATCQIFAFAGSIHHCTVHAGIVKMEVFVCLRILAHFLQRTVKRDEYAQCWHSVCMIPRGQPS